MTVSVGLPSRALSRFIHDAPPLVPLTVPIFADPSSSFLPNLPNSLSRHVRATPLPEITRHYLAACASLYLACGRPPLVHLLHVFRDDLAAGRSTLFPFVPTSRYALPTSPPCRPPPSFPGPSAHSQFLLSPKRCTPPFSRNPPQPRARARACSRAPLAANYSTRPPPLCCCLPPRAFPHTLPVPTTVSANTLRAGAGAGGEGGRGGGGAYGSQ